MILVTIEVYRYANSRTRELGLPFVGVMPRHVYLLGGSHCLLLVIGAIYVVEPFGQISADYGALVFMAAVIFTLYGLIEMLRYQRLRLRLALRKIAALEERKNG
jgi:hypothetical protein